MRFRLMRSLSVGTIIAPLVAGVLACSKDDPKGARGGTPPRRLAGVVVTTASASMAPRAPRPGLILAHSPSMGLYLADATGRAVYMLESERDGKINCYDRCTAIWPPFLVAAPPVAADSLIDAHRIGLVRRRDGAGQATYNRHPLYYYLGDSGPGSTRGHHVEDSWGEWYLVEGRGTRAADRTSPSHSVRSVSLR